MRLTEDIKPVTYMKMRSAELLRKVRENRRPVVITQNGEARVVVLDVDSYRALRDTTLLLKLLARSERQIRDGKTLSQAEVFARMERKFAEAGKRRPRRKKHSRR